MRRLMIFAVAGLFALPSAAMTPWEAYIAEPTPGRAEEVKRIAYSSGKRDQDRLFSDLMILEEEVTAGEESAVQLAFRLLSESDAHLTETLLIMLGGVVSTYPGVFLRAAARSAVSAETTADAATWLDFDYADRLDAQEKILEARVEALKRVAAGEVEALKEACIEALQSRLGSLRRERAGT